MKTNNIFRLLTLALAAVAFAFVTACEGPQGEQGPAGPAGADGQDGTNGIDANETCKQCHNEGTDVLNAVTQQFGESGHAVGTYYDREGECAGCHNTEGFLSRVGLTGADEWAAVSGTSAKTQISCYTCHPIHATYTEADWGLTNVAQVTTLFGLADASDGHDPYTMSDNGDNNLCLQCHQSRDRGGVPTPTSTEDVVISSPHWGPHYGIQGQVLLAYNHAGPGTGYPTEGVATHGGTSCIGCHMDEKNHTLAFEYDNCATGSCHGGNPDLVETKHDELKAEIHDDLFALGAYLTTQGAMKEVKEDDVIIGYAPAAGYGQPVTVSAALGRGVWNYMTVYQDHSYGVHNPSYIRTLLANSKTELGY